MTPLLSSATTSHIEAGSFRDRNGRIYYIDGTVYRGVSEQSLRDWQMLSQTTFFKTLTSERKLVRTEQVDPANIPDASLLNEWAAVLNHEGIPFVSYPYEWSFTMLKDAALLQLELLDRALDENMTLKDASGFNTQWVGAMPVFIDIPSFERYVDGTPWIGYRQFCEMFLYPLMLQAYKDVSFHALLRGRIDGITPEDCNNLMSRRDMLRPGVFMHVYLQSKLQAKYGRSDRQMKKEIQSSGFTKELIKANVRRLRNLISKLRWKRSSSEWSHYVQEMSYTEIDGGRKADFVRSVIGERKRNLVWDIGCNTGTFSRIAAENAAYVVAMDSDHLAVERLYQQLKKEQSRMILPLNMNLADASPAQGWRGMERKSLSERGKPDLILCLALIHHIVISANIPMKEFIYWLASFGSDLAIEFVTKDDPMVKVLLKNKEDQYADYDQVFFERLLRERYTSVRSEALSSGTRMLYQAKDVKSL